MLLGQRDQCGPHDTIENVPVGGVGAKHDPAAGGIAADHPGVGRRALGDLALRVDHPGFVGPGFGCGLLGQYVGQQRDALDVRPCPALVRPGDHVDHPRLAQILGHGQVPGRDHQRRGHRLGGELVVPRRLSAGNLHVNKTIAHPVQPRHPTPDQAQRLTVHRPVDTQLGQPPVEAIPVPVLVDEGPRDHRYNLVNPVGKLIATVFDSDLSVGVGDVAAVDVGGSGHGWIPSQFPSACACGFVGGGQWGRTCLTGCKRAG